MTIALKPGVRLLCSGSTSEFIVVRADGEYELSLGGNLPLLSRGDPQNEPSPLPGWSEGALLGKRYISDDHNSLELLCTKAGSGVPGLNGAPLTIKDAKPLPASD